MLSPRFFADTNSAWRIRSTAACTIGIGILAAISRFAVLTAIAQEPSPKLQEIQQHRTLRGDSFALPKQQLAQYRAELGRFRNDYGGAYDLPDEQFFLFGMGLRPKFLYKGGVLTNAITGASIQQWEVAEDLILPSEYTVVIRTGAGEIMRITEDEKAVWIEKEGLREALPETSVPVRLPQFTETRYPALMRVLHQELLVNVIKAGPVPNFFVYPKPWYRDGAMMALCFQATGNLDVIRDWVLHYASHMIGITTVKRRQTTSARRCSLPRWFPTKLTRSSHGYLLSYPSSRLRMMEENTSREDPTSRNTQLIRRSG